MMNEKMNTEKLVVENRQYVEAVAKQYLNQGLTLEQLIEEGNKGLEMAAGRFDQDKGCAFMSYAVWWVRQSILQALADKAEGVDGNQLTERERFILEHTDEEAAAHYEITTRRVQQIRERALRKQNPTNQKPNKMTNQEILQGLVIEGMKMRYGDKLKSVKISPAARRCSMIPVKMLWELKHIIDAGFVDYYLMMFWLFHQYAKSAGIGFWARGAMNSSIVCYCLGLTEVDPMKYGLHSARFVNDELPKFQFDIEASRFDEFMKEAEVMLQAHSNSLDVEAVKASLFKNLTPMDYLSNKHERPLPENLDDELARYALYFPQTMDLYKAYIQEPSTFDRLIYQEQMMDLLRETFHVSGIKANKIRLAIQRGETEKVKIYKKELFADLNDITIEEAETAWQRLTSNPRAFLKAHAVSRVIEKYKYDMNGQVELHWKQIREYSEGLAALQVSSDKWGFIDQRGKVVIPCQWKDALFFSEGLAGVQDSSGKWGFIDQKGKLVIPYQWKFVHEAYFESLVGVQDINGKWGYIDKTGKMIIPCIWNRAYVFREGLAGVQDSEGKWGFIDKTGKVIIPCQWEGVNSFSEGWAGIMDSNGKWGFIDKIGKVVLPCKWSNVLFFIKGKARVQTSRFGDYHFIDKNGNDVQ